MSLGPALADCCAVVHVTRHATRHTSHVIYVPLLLHRWEVEPLAPNPASSSSFADADTPTARGHDPDDDTKVKRHFCHFASVVMDDEKAGSQI